MAGTNVLQELKALIRSMHPVVLMQTIEEERVDDLLRAVAAELSQDTPPAPVHAHGPRHLPPEGPAAHLDDAATCRAFRGVAQAFGRTPDGNAFELGGFDRLKAWLARAVCAGEITPNAATPNAQTQRLGVGMVGSWELTRNSCAGRFSAAKEAIPDSPARGRRS